MTFSARFTVVEVNVEDGLVRAQAQTEDGSLTQNTEHATGMELLVHIDAEHETTVKTGDVITASGHFTG